MLVTDRRRAQIPLLEAIKLAIAGGVDVVQIREKDLSAPDGVRLASQIIEIVADRAAIVINSDVESARLLRTGLHLSDSELNGDLVDRSTLQPGTMIGRSIHRADEQPDPHYDYVLFGHIYPTASKSGSAPRGLAQLRHIVLRSGIPVWAIGGITAENVSDVIETGAMGVAVIGAILDSLDPEGAAREIRTAIDTASRSFAGER